ncbi:hypothetical protein GJ496_008742 [Pomphorhynchus laevis]|nr:hypothetical protein GJ496_008742 [Pomphorhynchus laevis]
MSTKSSSKSGDRRLGKACRPRESESHGICNRYLTTGKCEHGSDCKYLHVDGMSLATGKDAPRIAESLEIATTFSKELAAKIRSTVVVKGSKSKESNEDEMMSEKDDKEISNDNTTPLRKSSKKSSSLKRSAKRKKRHSSEKYSKRQSKYDTERKSKRHKIRRQKSSSSRRYHHTSSRKHKRKHESPESSVSRSSSSTLSESSDSSITRKHKRHNCHRRLPYSPDAHHSNFKHEKRSKQQVVQGSQSAFDDENTNKQSPPNIFDVAPFPNEYLQTGVNLPCSKSSVTDADFNYAIVTDFATSISESDSIDIKNNQNVKKHTDNDINFNQEKTAKAMDIDNFQDDIELLEDGFAITQTYRRLNKLTSATRILSKIGVVRQYLSPTTNEIIDKLNLQLKESPLQIACHQLDNDRCIL